MQVHFVSFLVFLLAGVIFINQASVYVVIGVFVVGSCVMYQAYFSEERNWLKCRLLRTQQDEDSDDEFPPYYDYPLQPFNPPHPDPDSPCERFVPCYADLYPSQPRPWPPPPPPPSSYYRCPTPDEIDFQRRLNLIKEIEARRRAAALNQKKREPSPVFYYGDFDPYNPSKASLKREGKELQRKFEEKKEKEAKEERERQKEIARGLQLLREKWEEEDRRSREEDYERSLLVPEDMPPKTKPAYKKVPSTSGRRIPLRRREECGVLAHHRQERQLRRKR